MRPRNITWIEWLVGLALVAVLATTLLAVWVEVRGWAVKSGVVDSKSYTAPWTDFHTTGGEHPVSVPVYHPERYCVTVIGKTAEGEQRARHIQVDQTTYHSVKVGQKWTEKRGFQ